MNIDGIDASAGLTINKNYPVKADSAEIVNIKPALNSLIESKNISQITELDKKELSISDRVVIEAIEKANKAISGGTRKFEFSIHDKTKQIMIKVIDSDTNEVIREIPPEKILDMVAKMWEMAGIIVDERR